MTTFRLLLILLGVAAVGTIPAVADASVPETTVSDAKVSGAFEKCEKRRLSRRSSCFFSIAQRYQRWADGEERLTALRAANPDDALAVYWLARLKMATGETASAADLYGEAAVAFAAEENSSYETYSLLDQGECLLLENRIEEASEVLTQATRAAKATGDINLLGHARLKEIRVARLRGDDFQNIEHRLRELGEVLFQDGEAVAGDQLVDAYFLELGAVLMSLRRHDEALALNQRWAESARSRDNKAMEATARVNMAACIVDMPWRPNAREEALALAEEALVLTSEASQVFAELEALRLLGMMRPGNEGREALQRCLEKAPPESTSALLCRFALAGALAEDEPQKARRQLDEALALSARAEDPWSGLHGWNGRLQVSWGTLSREKALRDSLALLDLIESLRRLQISEHGRADFFASWAEVYQAVIGRLLSPQGGESQPSRAELEAAFAVSERMRARVLLDSLAAAKAVPNGDSVEERTTVLRRIVQHQRRLLSPDLQGAERQEVLAALADAEDELAVIETRLGNRLSDVGNEMASLAEVEESLADDEALLVFQLAPDEDVFGQPAGGSWLFAVTREGTRLYRLPDGHVLNAKSQMLLGLVESRRSGDLADQAAAALYEDLLAPAIQDLAPEIQRWTLMPDGVLHLLPFALLAPDGEWSTVPSATLWQRWRRSAETPVKGALAFADPANTSGATAVERLGELERGVELGALPHARREGRRLIRHLGGRLLVEEEATEAFLKSVQPEEFGVFHFATHALVDERRPYRSAILLAPGGAHEDGLVQPRDIVNLELDGKLVVLSACQSASGKVRLGEGIDSLANAFFRAGARAVVASFWRLRDDDAAAFFDELYAALARGASVRAAVAAARSERRAAGAPPNAWAGVVVLGDGGWEPIPGGRPNRWPAFVGPTGTIVVVCGLALVLLFVALRRNRSTQDLRHPLDSG